jgi:hypothetical protein
MDCTAQSVTEGEERGATNGNNMDATLFLEGGIVTTIRVFMFVGSYDVF